jgi:signal transduction histidine kinase
MGSHNHVKRKNSAEVSGRKKTPSPRNESPSIQLDEQSIALSTFINEVLEEEKALISRELHNVLGQQLTALKMDLFQIASKQLGASEASQRLGETISLADTIIDTVRKISTDLRPSMLDDLGLLATLEWHCQQFQVATGITCNFIADINNVEFEKGFSNGVYRILHEALTNVKRHAEASRVTVEVHRDKTIFSLKVADNGVGIMKHGVKSFGLLGMKERARLLGGTLRLHSEEKKGTTVTVVLPLDQI